MRVLDCWRRLEKQETLELFADDDNDDDHEDQLQQEGSGGSCPGAIIITDNNNDMMSSSSRRNMQMMRMMEIRMMETFTSLNLEDCRWILRERCASKLPVVADETP